MWTKEYRGYFIHGYCDRDTCKVQGRGFVSKGRGFKSLHAAKLAITRMIKLTTMMDN